MKEDANKKVANRQYKEALDLYLQALEIEGLTPDLKAVLYSNLSHVLVELSPTDKEKLHEALQYAKTACLLLPEWWRGYQRKGRVYFLLNKYKKSVVGKYFLGNFKKMYADTTVNQHLTLDCCSIQQAQKCKSKEGRHITRLPSKAVWSTLIQIINPENPLSKLERYALLRGCTRLVVTNGVGQ